MTTCLLILSLGKVLNVIQSVFLGTIQKKLYLFSKNTKDQTVFHFCMQTDKEVIMCFLFVCLENSLHVFWANTWFTCLPIYLFPENTLHLWQCNYVIRHNSQNGNMMSLPQALCPCWPGRLTSLANPLRWRLFEGYTLKVIL